MFQTLKKRKMFNKITDFIEGHDILSAIASILKENLIGLGISLSNYFVLSNFTLLVVNWVDIEPGLVLDWLKVGSFIISAILSFILSTFIIQQRFRIMKAKSKAAELEMQIKMTELKFQEFEYAEKTRLIEEMLKKGLPQK